MDDDDPDVDWNDKGDITDWFSFDFTLAELKTLKKKQANNFRDPRYDWAETVVTLEELVNITKYVQISLMIRLRFKYFLESLERSKEEQ